jgi:hypothetical protein
MTLTNKLIHSFPPDLPIFPVKWIICILTTNWRQILANIILMWLCLSPYFLLTIWHSQLSSGICLDFYVIVIMWSYCHKVVLLSSSGLIVIKWSYCHNVVLLS